MLVSILYFGGLDVRFGDETVILENFIFTELLSETN